MRPHTPGPQKRAQNDALRDVPSGATGGFDQYLLLEHESLGRQRPQSKKPSPQGLSICATSVVFSLRIRS